MLAILLVLLAQEPDKPAWAKGRPPESSSGLLAPEGVSCKRHFAVVWRDWEDAANEKSGELGKAPLSWWNEEGRREFPSLCPVRDVGKADFIYTWSTRRFKESCVETQNVVVENWLSESRVRVPVKTECERQVFYVELKCGASGQSLRSATQRTDEPAVFTFDDAVRMMADPKTPCPGR